MHKTAIVQTTPGHNNIAAFNTQWCSMLWWYDTEVGCIEFTVYGSQLACERYLVLTTTSDCWIPYPPLTVVRSFITQHWNAVGGKHCVLGEGACNRANKQQQSESHPCEDTKAHLSRTIMSRLSLFAIDALEALSHTQFHDIHTKYTPPNTGVHWLGRAHTNPLDNPTQQTQHDLESPLRVYLYTIIDCRQTRF